MGEIVHDPHRAMCYRCHKPEASCLCSFITMVDNQTHVLILQHPRERFHPVGTARIANLALKESHLEVAWKGFCDQDNFGALLQPGAGILYPSDDARDLATVPADEMPKQLVVLDGTWHTAKQIYRDHAALHGLPKFSLSPIEPSLYRIRKAPKPEQRSTIEAIWQALLHIEPQTPDLNTLLEPFREMIDRQMGFQGHPRPRTKKRSHVPRKPLPEPLTHRYHNLVIGYGEFVPAPDRPLGYQLLVWTAYKPSTGESFSQTLAPDGPQWITPSSNQLEHMGLSEEALANGMSLKQFKKSWEEFAGSDYTLGTWNEITHRLFRTLLRDNSPAIQLKRVYCSLSGGKCGPLHKVVEKHDLITPDLDMAIRAGLRLANACAITSYLRERGLERLEELEN